MVLAVVIVVSLYDGNVMALAMGGVIVMMWTNGNTTGADFDLCERHARRRRHGGSEKQWGEVFHGISFRF
jgi:hypothetical protein